MSTIYQPSSVSDSFSQEQRRWLEAEFAALKRGLEAGKSSERYVVLHAEPAKLFDGLVAFADGGDWNPGAGAGVYCYYDSAWHKLGGELVGTFTPVIQGTTTAGTGTYTLQYGDYRLLGDRCFFNITLVWSAHTGTGNLKVEGLPFTSASGDGRWPVTAYSFGLSLTASSVLQALIPTSATRIGVGTYPAGGGSLSDIPMDSAGTLYLAGQYVIA